MAAERSQVTRLQSQDQANENRDDRDCDSSGPSNIAGPLAVERESPPN